MTHKYRCLAPSVAKSAIVTPGGRSYSPSPGAIADVELSDAQSLQANGWMLIAAVGPSADRPTHTGDAHAVGAGLQYFDTTLTEMIVFDGLAWRDTTGALA